MSQRYNDDIKSSKPQDTQLGILKNISILPETLAEDLGSSRECCWHYVVSAFENIPKNVVVQGRVQLEHRSHMVKVSI